MPRYINKSCQALVIGFFILTSNQNLSAQEIKKADLAGTWYPSDKDELSVILDGYIEQALVAGPEGRIMGLISPHAGYAFSGRTAGYGFRAVEDAGYNTVVIIGFSHRKFYNGISVYNTGVFRTPLGEVPVDVEFANRLMGCDKAFVFYPALFSNENSVEMQIPFVQASLKEARIVPVAFGGQDYRLCGVLAKALADIIKGRDDVLVIASTDMSHFHGYDEAVRMDNFTITKIKELNPEILYNEIKSGACELCGSLPVTTLIMTMKMLGAGNVKILKYENSGDVTGDRKSVVGYVSAVFYKKIEKEEGRGMKDEKEKILNEKQRKRLLEIARSTIEEYLKTGKVLDVKETDPELMKEKGAFVTLHYKGDLRGCIGNIIASGPLYKTVRDMAIESSTHDPRFPQVSLKELKDIKIEISVLSVPERVIDVNSIIMGKHGVIVRKGYGSGVFLPQVATETGWNRDEFLSNLCTHKAGLPADAWKDPDTELYSFTAEVFGE